MTVKVQVLKRWGGSSFLIHHAFKEVLELQISKLLESPVHLSGWQSLLNITGLENDFPPAD